MILWHVCAHVCVCVVHPYQLGINTEIFVGKIIHRSRICFKNVQTLQKEGGRKLIQKWQNADVMNLVNRTGEYITNVLISVN